MAAAVGIYRLHTDPPYHTWNRKGPRSIAETDMDYSSMEEAQQRHIPAEAGLSKVLEAGNRTAAVVTLVVKYPGVRWTSVMAVEGLTIPCSFHHDQGYCDR